MASTFFNLQEMQSLALVHLFSISLVGEKAKIRKHPTLDHQQEIHLVEDSGPTSFSSLMSCGYYCYLLKHRRRTMTCQGKVFCNIGSKDVAYIPHIYMNHRIILSFFFSVFARIASNYSKKKKYSTDIELWDTNLISLPFRQSIRWYLQNIYWTTCNSREANVMGS